MSQGQMFIELEHHYSAHNYHPLPVVLTKGQGVWVWDCDGNKYMDMLSSYSALNQGHCHPKLIDTLQKQAERLTLTSRAFHNDQLGPLAKMLVELTQMEVALFMNSGAEAVETMIKMARKWGYKKKGVAANQAEIITCENNFHGRTTTIVGFSTEAQYQDGFGPFTPGFKTIPYNNISALKNAITPNTVAFLVEPIQGEGGILIPDSGYLKEIRAICTEKKILFLADEIQTGLGRTGKMFACQHEQVQPDAYSLGKALSGGAYPVSAVVSKKEFMDVFQPGDHGSTFGGNPLGCAIARAALEILEDEQLANNAHEMGTYFIHQLNAINSPHVKEVRGRGLLIGVEIKESSGVARPYCEKLMQRGILAKETHHQVIRFAPPLVISKEEIDWAMESIREVLK